MKTKFFYGTNPTKTLPKKFSSFIEGNNVEISNFEADGVGNEFNGVCLLIHYKEVEEKNFYRINIIGPCRNDNIEGRVNLKIKDKKLEYLKVVGCKDCFFVIIVTLD